MASTVTITTENDADFERSFIYQYSNGVPVDMTGASLRMMLRRHAEDVTALLKLTTPSSGLTIDDPTNGRFTVTITQAQLLELDPGQYDHSLIMTTPDGEQTRIWSGTLTNLEGPSR
jgi:hypothetical protein